MYLWYIHTYARACVCVCMRFNNLQLNSKKKRWRCCGQSARLSISPSLTLSACTILTLVKHNIIRNHNNKNENKNKYNNNNSNNNSNSNNNKSITSPHRPTPPQNAPTCFICFFLFFGSSVDTCTRGQLVNALRRNYTVCAIRVMQLSHTYRNNNNSNFNAKNSYFFLLSIFTQNLEIVSSEASSSNWKASKQT